MTRRGFRLAAGMALGCALSITSCSGGERSGPDTAVEETGSLGLALQATAPSGKVYRVRDGVFEVHGDLKGRGAPGAVLRTEDDPDRAVLETVLAAGAYAIALAPGWYLERIDTDPAATRVDATLLSDAVQHFLIHRDKTTFVKYSFEVDGEHVVFEGNGQLVVGAEVTEREGGPGCGNGRIDPGEACDGADLGGETCASVTMLAKPVGTLHCSPACTFDLRDCRGPLHDDTDGGGGTSGEGGTTGGGGLTGGGGIFGDAGPDPNGGAGGKECEDDPGAF
jgi:uncharacterized membrane protein YgcG